MKKFLENKNDLIKYFEKGSKQKKFWKIGTEHEKFIYDLNTLNPIDYNGRNGIKSLFKLFKKKSFFCFITKNNLIFFIPRR